MKKELNKETQKKLEKVRKAAAERQKEIERKKKEVEAQQ